MKIANYTKKGEKIAEFDVSGVDVRMLNMFRRTIVSSIPVMAVEKVIFYDNSSIMNDENLAHRIGLVPLSTDQKTYVLHNQCKCSGEGCARCTCKLALDVTGPATVYSGDMKSQDENVKPVFEKIPLIKLSSDQKLKFEAEAIMGIGKEHVKWQPGMASYEAKGKDEFHVLVESYGPLPVEELIKSAFEVVEQKIGQLKENT